MTFYSPQNGVSRIHTPVAHVLFGRLPIGRKISRKTTCFWFLFIAERVVVSAAPIGNVRRKIHVLLFAYHPPPHRIRWGFSIGISIKARRTERRPISGRHNNNGRRLGAECRFSPRGVFLVYTHVYICIFVYYFVYVDNDLNRGICNAAPLAHEKYKVADSVFGRSKRMNN